MDIDSFPNAQDLQRRFHRDGFVIIENVLSQEDVNVLRREADCLINFLISEDMDIMTDFGGIIEPLACGYTEPPASQMYSLSKKSYSSFRDMVTEAPDTVVPILFEKLPMFARLFLPLGDSSKTICLFNEQYIIKTPNTLQTSSFAWHQDSQYMDPSAREANSVVSCWTALDNVNLSNGTLIIEPFPRLVDATTEKVLELPATEALDDPEYFLRYHRAISSRYLTELDPATAVEQARRNHVRSDCANPAPSKSKREGALTPDDLMTIIETCPIERQTPILVEIPAGSVVFLSGFVRHCSLGNSTSLFRRAFMPQYSAGKVETSEGGLVSLAVPCEE